jgi:L,D-transpeptidase ErfK/SrfK
MNFKTLTILIPILLFTSSVAAEEYPFTKNDTVIGSLKTYEIKGDESLIEIARKFGLGFNEITEANPELDPFVPGDGVIVNLPTAWILPDLSSYDGIVINLSEMRLYFFPRQRRSSVMTFPIGIGSEGNETPLGIFKIVEKTANPSWYVPESIRRERPELPKIVPPGRDNPLGSHALRLSERTILIHGTNRPYAVGRKASHGCIRLYPEDIPKVFRMVPQETKVTIIRQPVKAGRIHERVYIEVHKDKELNLNYFNEAVEAPEEEGSLQYVDKKKCLQL